MNAHHQCCVALYLAECIGQCLYWSYNSVQLIRNICLPTCSLQKKGYSNEALFMTQITHPRPFPNLSVVLLTIFLFCSFFNQSLVRLVILFGQSLMQAGSFQPLHLLKQRRLINLWYPPVLRCHVCKYPNVKFL